MLSTADQHSQEMALHALLEVCTTDTTAALQAMLILLMEEQVGAVIGVDEPLMQAGLTSLKATRFISAIKDQLGSIAQLEIIAVFNFPTLSQLASHIEHLAILVGIRHCSFVRGDV